MISLEPVNKRTFRKVVDMKLSDEQNRFVAPNVVSLAQAWLYYDEALPYAILNDGEVVGFIMFDRDEDERTLGIWRFMIAPEHQHKGYGRAAMEAAVRLGRESGKFDLMHLDYVPGNEVARDLYYSIGFRENGDVEDGEIIMTLPLTDAPKVGILTADDEDTEDFTELIEDEKQYGTSVPEIFTDEKKLREAVTAEKVKRLTLMGETIGIAVDGELLVAHEQLSRIGEIKAKLVIDN